LIIKHVNDLQATWVIVHIVTIVGCLFAALLFVFLFFSFCFPFQLYEMNDELMHCCSKLLLRYSQCRAVLMNPAELSGVIHLDVVIRKYANEPRDACLSENVNGVNFHWQVLIALVVYGRHLETL